MSKKKDMGVFGDPSYIVRTFDDVDTAVRSEKSQAAKEIKAFVNSKATKKDNMHCYGVVKTKGVSDGKPREGIVVHVGLGLNGPGRNDTGRNGDYFAALKRLADTGRFRLVDMHVDALDDLWDALFAVAM